MRMKATAPVMGVVLAVCMAVGWSPAHSKAQEAHDESAARLFLNSLGERAIAVAQDTNSSLPERERRLRLLLREGFDVNVIARFVLGPPLAARNPMSSAANSSSRSKTCWLPKPSSISRTTKAKPSTSGRPAPTPRIRDCFPSPQPSTGPNGTKARVNWRLLKKGDDYRVIDVVLEGVSIALTLRSEFGAVIQQSGGVQGTDRSSEGEEGREAEEHGLTQVSWPE